MITATLKDKDGKEIGMLVADDKVFSSGKTGFWGQMKLNVNGSTHQAQLQVVKVTPKVA
jgi:hypothetical protein